MTMERPHRDFGPEALRPPFYERPADRGPTARRQTGRGSERGQIAARTSGAVPGPLPHPGGGAGRVTSQGGPFEHTRGPVTSALARSSSVLRELGQVWRDAEAQLV